MKKILLVMLLFSTTTYSEVFNEYKIEKGVKDIDIEFNSIIYNLYVNNNVYLKKFNHTKILKITFDDKTRILEYPDQKSMLCNDIVYDRTIIDDKTDRSYKDRILGACLINRPNL